MVLTKLKRINCVPSTYKLQLQYSLASDTAILHGVKTDVYAIVGDHNLSVSFEVCIKPHVKFMWRLNSDDLPDDVILDTNGAGITIPEVHDEHFGLYEFLAMNVKNVTAEKRTFSILG